MTGDETPSSACTRRPDEIGTDGFSSSRLAGTISGERSGGGGGGFVRGGKGAATSRDTASRGPTTIPAPESQFRTCPTDHGLGPVAISSRRSRVLVLLVLVVRAAVTALGLSSVVSVETNTLQRSVWGFRVLATIVDNTDIWAQPSQPSQSSQQPQQSAQQSGRHRFRPRGHQFKKKQGS
ncbi:hypothetical protein F511_31335 [Dorcoceras hygrometricum]|uniref:Uncharacterized protein n=1 Tax=Dorcoceras hygrometricum TaxID=472368 RepID=A0A2Z7AZZ5_9LAMI|nr:hypothetical protein F511_31335 [Dorcoceras hygrometricum]